MSDTHNHVDEERKATEKTLKLLTEVHTQEMLIYGVRTQHSIISRGSRLTDIS